jgi:hypothetical protein
METLELEKEFIDEHNVKHSRIYGNNYAYLYEMTSDNGKTSFKVYDRLKTAKMKHFDAWVFKKDTEAVTKYNSIIKQ